MTIMIILLNKRDNYNKSSNDNSNNSNSSNDNSSPSASAQKPATSALLARWGCRLAPGSSSMGSLSRSLATRAAKLCLGLLTIYTRALDRRSVVRDGATLEVHTRSMYTVSNWCRIWWMVGSASSSSRRSIAAKTAKAALSLLLLLLSLSS